jgi:hypothetical protein
LLLACSLTGVCRASRDLKRVPPTANPLAASQIEVASNARRLQAPGDRIGIEGEPLINQPGAGIGEGQTGTYVYLTLVASMLGLQSCQGVVLPDIFCNAVSGDYVMS